MLKYVGRGSFIPGIPAKDLSEEEVIKLGTTQEELVSTGLWVKMEEEPKVTKASSHQYSNKEK